MTGTGSRASIIGPALAIGGLCLLGLIGLVIAAIIVLSIIPTYTQSNAVEGMGEEYRMDQLILRAFTDSSYAANKSIANSSDLSLACTKAMQSGGDASFYACVVATIRAANGTPLANDTMRRKRYTASLVLICTARLFYKSRCVDAPPNSAYNHTNTSLSSCRKRRIAKINNILNSSSPFDSTDLVPYLTYTDGTILSILYGLYLLKYTLYSTYAGISTDGVAYLQQISIASINQLIASQTRFSTTAAYSSSMSAG